MRLNYRLGLTLLALVLGGSVECKDASAQLEWSITGGSWTAFLPEYEAGTVLETGETLLSADQSDLGGRIQLHSFYHFEPTRTMLEFRATLAGADISGSRWQGEGSATTTLGGTLPDGSGFTAGDGESYTASIRSRTMYNDVLIGLRDKFDLSDYGLGLITLGAGFSHMHFDTTFDTMLNVDSGDVVFDGVENLQSSYVGGEIVGGATCQIFGRNVYLDSSLGIYDLHAEYESEYVSSGTTALPDVRTTEELNDVAYTFGLTLKTDFRFGGVNVRPTTGVQYISSMPGITRAAGGSSVLRDDNAFILNGGWEFTF